MKKLSFLAFSLAFIAVLAGLLTSCSSDPNPVDFIRTDGDSKDAKTYIQLSLNPSAPVPTTMMPSPRWTYMCSMRMDNLRMLWPV